MIKIAEAIKIIKDQEIEWPTEEIELENAAGRIMTCELTSPLDSPPFAKAAMDGYAVGSADKSGRYKILEIIAAGTTPTLEVVPGACSKIMTGAMLPIGADKIIRVEFADEMKGYAIPHTPEPAANIIAKGENLTAGDKVLSPGKLEAKDIGIAASMGFPSLKVSKRAVIGVLTTGSELKNPGEKLAPGQIYNSNGLQLTAQITATGSIPRYYGIIEDDRNTLSLAIEKALTECDIVLLSGGVSKGDYDYVPEVLEENGMETLFHRVSIKPGRPLLFGRKDDVFVFGLPGNPVSTFVCFEVFVNTLLWHLAGLNYEPAWYQGKLTESITRKDTDRTEFHPVVISGADVRPLKYHGSSHINALAEANGMIIIPDGVEGCKKGEDVSVRPI